MINKDTLYDKALRENVPFFKWYTWIEGTINKEVLSKIIKDKKSGTSPNKPQRVTAALFEKLKPVENAPTAIGGAPPKQLLALKKTNEPTESTTVE
jgi:hypothetical protein